MSILIGAIALHDASAMLNQASQRLRQEGYFASYAYVQGEHLVLESPEPHSDLTQNTPAGILSLGLYATSNSPYLFRGRLLIALLGRVENLAQLLEKLESRGYAQNLPNQEAVIAALIDWHDRSQKNLRRATQLALKEAQGYFACCVMQADLTQTLICASKGPQLFVAQTANGSYFSNESQLIREHAALCIGLDQDEVAELSPHKISCFDYEDQPRHKDPIPAHTANRFAHHMQADIMAQPLLLAQLINHYLDNQLSEFLNQTGRAHAYQRVLMLASGSSHHAAAVAQFWIEQIAGIPTQLEYASEYRYRQPLFEANTLVIAISQSGETADTIAALQKAMAIGHQDTVLISNQTSSTLGRMVKYHLGQFAGKELSATSTKTFSTQLLCLYFVALKLAEGRQIFPSAAIAELQRLPRAVAETLVLSTPLNSWAQNLSQLQSVFLVGRNMHLPVALEAAQKLKEICYLHAEGYPAGEIKHGPVTLIGERTPVIACLPWDLMADKMLANLHEVKARQGEIYLLSDVKLTSGERFHCIQMPQQLPLLNPILYSVAFQLLSYLSALNRGNNVDMPRNIQKTQDKE